MSIPTVEPFPVWVRAVCGVIMAILIIALIFLVGSFVAACATSSSDYAWEAKCIEAGVGEYHQPDPTRKRLEFRFKTPSR
jgi:hypothetical protein